MQRIALLSRFCLAGFSLLEVLSALFLLGFALLALQSLQLKSLILNQEIYYERIAFAEMEASVLQRSDITHLSSFFIDWHEINATLLPEGQGRFSTNTVAVTWLDRYDNKIISREFSW